MDAQDIKDAVADLRRCIELGADDEWIVGFVRQYPFKQTKPDAQAPWISVKDRLPEFDFTANIRHTRIHVIAALDDGSVSPMIYAANSWILAEAKPSWFFADGRKILSHHITHWMPYPEYVTN